MLKVYARLIGDCSMKTKFALAFYYLAIGLLTACAIVVVVKLIFWPPCTQTGNTCVIDPWSVAGLAATILGVAGTILAVLGAVAVAAWWTSLNDRVIDQVNKQVDKLVPAQVLTLVTKLVPTQVTNLYNTQKAEVDHLLAEQRNELNKLQKQTKRIDGRLQEESKEINGLKQLSQDVEDITIDGLMAIGAPSLEAWAQKAIQKKLIPRLPLRMTTGYLDALKYGIPEAEQNWKKQIEQFIQQLEAYQQLLSRDKEKDVTISTLSEEIKQLLLLIPSLNLIVSQEPKIIGYWNQALYWLDQTKQEEDSLTYEPIENQLEAYRLFMENFKREYEQLQTVQTQINEKPLSQLFLDVLKFRQQGPA